MFHYDACILTPNDHARLRDLLNQEDGHASPRAEILRHKLATALIIEPGQIGPEVATLGSLVRFRLDGAASEDRVIVTDIAEAGGRPALLAWTGRGLALLGLAAGRSRQHVGCDGGTETLTLEAVLERDATRPPEAAKPMPTRSGGPVLFGPDSDDWGPAAA